MGGKIVTRYYNAIGLRSVIHPEKFAQTPKLAAPLRKEELSKSFLYLIDKCCNTNPFFFPEYYIDPKNRGYLAQQEA